ncbi:TPA: hypothetical protein GXZ54_01200 [bacterium]|nr:hypothetical protein [bacterium]
MNDNNIFGYYTGLTFFNKLGLTTQVPNVIEVTTNKEKSNKRTININGRKVILRRGKVFIDNDNYKVLQFLDMFNMIKLYQIEENYDILKKYITENDFNQKNIVNLLPKYSSKVIRLIFESGLINEFTQ